MYELNNKLKKLDAYDPITGSYEIRLDANESPYNLPDYIMKDIADRICALSFNRYPDPLATDAVNAFAKYYNLDSDNVTGGNGSDEIISIIESCFFEKGDRILSFSNDFSMYRFYAELYELENVVYQKNDDLSVDVDKVIEICNTQNIRAVIFSNPCNPTSLGIEKNEVLRLIENVNCLVIADEAYMDFWNQSILDKVNDYDNLIILKTCSKAVGLAGIRLGFAVANKTITNALRSAKSPYNTDSISQLVGAALFEEEKWLKKACADIIGNTEKLYDEICRICSAFPNILAMPQKPCTNFVFIKSDYCDEVFKSLQNKSIAIRNFKTYVRICCGTKSENQCLLTALEEICEELSNNLVYGG